MKPEQAEIARLKREVTRLKAERDILKSRRLLREGIGVRYLLHPPRLIDLKTTVFFAPAIVALSRDPGFRASHRCRLTLCHRYFNLTKQRRNPLRTNPPLGPRKRSQVTGDQTDIGLCRSD